MTTPGKPQSALVNAEVLHEPSVGKNIVFFDGVCGFCNKFIQFVLENDVHDAFHFASLQSDFAERTLMRRGANPKDLDTVYLVANYGTDKERLLSRSDAAIYAIAHLKKGVKPLATILGIFPKSLRDLGYNMVAKIRYKLFGKMDHCMLPSPESRSKFIEQ